MTTRILLTTCEIDPCRLYDDDWKDYIHMRKTNMLNTPQVKWARNNGIKMFISEYVDSPTAMMNALVTGELSDIQMTEFLLRFK